MARVESTRNHVIELLENFSGNGAEVGVQEGEFSAQLLAKTKATKIYLVDAWRKFEKYDDIANVEDSQHALKMMVCAENTSEHKARRCIINELSTEASKIFPDEFFDWVYIDADHSYEGCKADLIAWLPKVKAGGIICGDDFIDGVTPYAVFGVKKAVGEVFAGKQIGVISKENEMTQWWVRK